MKNKLVKQKNLGSYLQDISYYIVLKDKINVIEAKSLVYKIVKAIKTKLIFIKVNEMDPGFDVIAGIKESIIYLGYWGEYDFVRIFVSSCKRFNPLSVEKAIKKSFKVKSMVVNVLEDKQVEEIKKNIL